MKSSWQLVGEPAGKAQDHGFGEVASPSVPFQLAKRLLREGTFLHPSSHHGFANGLSPLSIQTQSTVLVTSARGGCRPWWISKARSRRHSGQTGTPSRSISVAN
jgi:hypothetical protein